MGSELQLDLEVTIHLQFLHLLLLCLAGTMRRPRGTAGEDAGGYCSENPQGSSGSSGSLVPMSSTKRSRAGADACHPLRLSKVDACHPLRSLASVAVQNEALTSQPAANEWSFLNGLSFVD